MGRLGGPELIIILVIVLLLFGAKKLPDLARSLGKSISEFHKGKDEGIKEKIELVEDTKKPEAPKQG